MGQIFLSHFSRPVHSTADDHQCFIRSEWALLGDGQQPLRGGDERHRCGDDQCPRRQPARSGLPQSRRSAGGSWHALAVAQFRGVELTGLEIPSERLLLRPWQPDDAPAVAAIMQSGALHTYLALPDPYTAEDATDFVTRTGHLERQQGTGLDCAVTERGSGRFVGSATLRLPFSTRPADIGYWIAPAARGHRYAAEASAALASAGVRPDRSSRRGADRRHEHRFGAGRAGARVRVRRAASRCAVYRWATARHRDLRPNRGRSGESDRPGLRAPSGRRPSPTAW